MEGSRLGSFAHPIKANPYHRSVPIAGAFSGMSTTSGQKKGQRVGQVIAQQYYTTTRAQRDASRNVDKDDSLLDTTLTEASDSTNYTLTVASHPPPAQTPPPRPKQILPPTEKRYTAAELQTMWQLGRGPGAMHGAELAPPSPGPVGKSGEARQARLKQMANQQRTAEKQRAKAAGMSRHSSENTASSFNVSQAAKEPERDKYGRKIGVHKENLQKLYPKAFVESPANGVTSHTNIPTDIPENGKLPDSLRLFIRSIGTSPCVEVELFEDLDDGRVLLEMVRRIEGEYIPDVDGSSSSSEIVRAVILLLARKDGWKMLPEPLRHWNAAEQWTQHSTGISTLLVCYLQQKKNRALQRQLNRSAAKRGKDAVEGNSVQEKPPFCAGQKTAGILGQYISSDDTSRFDKLKAKREQQKGEIMGTIRDMEEEFDRMKKDLVEHRDLIEKKERKIIRAREKQQEIVSLNVDTIMALDQKIASLRGILFDLDQEREALGGIDNSTSSPIPTPGQFSKYGHVNHLMHKLRLTESFLIIPDGFGHLSKKIDTKG